MSEDAEMIREGLRRGLVTDQTAACAIMLREFIEASLKDADTKVLVGIGDPDPRNKSRRKIGFSFTAEGQRCSLYVGERSSQEAWKAED